MIFSKSSSPLMILIYVETQLAPKYYKGLEKGRTNFIEI